ncbi:MAG: arginine kinase [Hyphomicrobiales bacterium]|nr:MAG: arginine kinase [Hyphomicrobiales bacterium]
MDMGFTARIEELKRQWPGNIALQCFDGQEYAALPQAARQRLAKCLASGVENPDSQMGCYACQPSDYDALKPFFSRVLARYHKVPEHARHVNDWDLSHIDGLPAGGLLDLAALGLPPLSMRVRAGRNLKDFPLPGAMDRTMRVQLEQRMMAAFEGLIADPAYGGRYHSLTPGNPCFIDERAYDELVAAHIMFKNMDQDRYLLAAGIAADWPHGRGCYVSADRAFIIWVGEEDHLRIMCMQRGTVLNAVFDRLKSALERVGALPGLQFAVSEDYGFVTSCPTNLGTGMRASVHMPLPNLTRDGTDAKARAIAGPLGLSVRGIGGEHTPIGADGTVDISPSARFCITEAEIIAALYQGIARLKSEEDKAAANHPKSEEN